MNDALVGISRLLRINKGPAKPPRKSEIRNPQSEIVSWVILTLLLFLLPSHSSSASDRALEIVREAERRQLTDNQSNNGAIEIIDGKGKVLNKSWQFWREGNRGTSKVLIRFLTPPEVRGVGFLTLNHPNSTADQWLYTPAIQRDRRVAPQEKTQRFMGTDFTNEDMEERSIEDYDYMLVGEEKLGGYATYKIKAVYKNKNNTQYSHLFLWIRQDITATSFMEMYVDGKVRKTLRWDEFKQVQGTWTPHLVEMKDLSRGSTTRIRASNVKYGLKFEPDWFSLRNLRKEP